MSSPDPAPGPAPRPSPGVPQSVAWAPQGGVPAAPPRGVGHRAGAPPAWPGPPAAPAAGRGLPVPTGPVPTVPAGASPYPGTWVPTQDWSAPPGWVRAPQVFPGVNQAVPLPACATGPATPPTTPPPLVLPVLPAPMASPTTPPVGRFAPPAPLPGAPPARPGSAVGRSGYAPRTVPARLRRSPAQLALATLRHVALLLLCFMGAVWALGGRWNREATLGDRKSVV